MDYHKVNSAIIKGIFRSTNQVNFIFMANTLKGLLLVLPVTHYNANLRAKYIGLVLYARVIYVKRFR